MKQVANKSCRLLLGTLICCLVMGTHTHTAAEDDLDSSRNKLNQIQKQIEKTLIGLRGKQSESGALARDLEKLAVEVRRVERQADKSERQLAELSSKLEAKRNELKETVDRKNIMDGRVRHRLAVLYKTGEVGLVRALLSESESPRDIMEKYAFLSRMVRHDRELLSTYRALSAEHRSALEELEALRKKQSALVVRNREEKDTLRRARNGKKILLAEVKKDSGILESMLKELRAKAARLNELVKRLETEQSQPYTGNLEGLLPHKGRLLWPVPGKLKTGFGTSRHGELGTLIESHGFEIEAAVGTPVNSVAPGKIIFANSLRGYGKLMIVDHGQKYYTLYAHMARFDKQLGDDVSAGEVIAYSGYEGRDAVYFEVRKGGKPLDPAVWLKSR